MYKGTVIKESLQDQSVLKNLTTSNERVAFIDNPAPDQPPTWTLYNFSVEDSDAESTAKILAEALKEGTWYIDMNDGNKSYVIFSNRVFAYEKENTEAREEAKKYGRMLGIPESQLNWKS